MQYALAYLKMPNITGSDCAEFGYQWYNICVYIDTACCANLWH